MRFAILLPILIALAGCGAGKQPAAAAATPTPAARAFSTDAKPGFDIRDAPIQGDADKEVCDLAAEALPVQFKSYLLANFVGDVTGDGKADRVAVDDTGTMHVLAVRLAEADGKSYDPDIPDGFYDSNCCDELSQYVLPYKGRAYVAGFVGRDPLYLRTVSRLTPDRKLLPLCRFTAKAEANLWADEASREYPGQDKVCTAVKAGGGTSVPERKYRNIKPDRGDGSVTGEVLVDFRNNGRPERLLRVEVASGAGPGCDRYGYRLPPGASARSRALLASL